jgi:hypothetical protein
MQEKCHVGENGCWQKQKKIGNLKTVNKNHESVTFSK